MKKIYLVFVLVLGTLLIANSTTYTSKANDDWNKASTWINGVPSGSSTDTVIVKHNVELVGNTHIIGMLTVESAGLISGNFELKIGEGSNSEGELYNYGTIAVKKFKVKDNNAVGATYLIGMPIAYNYSGGTISCTGGMHIGSNIGRGALINYSGGLIHVTGEFHLDNYLCNQGVIEITGNLKNHGGTIGCCGTMTMPTMSFELNGSRPGVTECMDVCDTTDGASSAPVVTIGTGGSKTTHSTLMSAYTASTTSSHATIMADSSLFCGLDTGGNAVSLPVTILYFFVSKLEHSISIKWATANEINNNYFTIEKSFDAIDFIPVRDVAGAGNSSEVVEYVETDILPQTANVYYRLMQVDYDGQFYYSKTLRITSDLEGRIGYIYPNPNSRETFNVWVGEDYYSKIIEIVSIDGKVVQRVHPESATTELRSLYSGMYFVHLIDTEQGSFKILKLNQK